MLDYHLLARNRKCDIVTVISVNKPEDDSLALLKALVKNSKYLGFLIKMLLLYVPVSPLEVYLNIW